MGTVVRIAVVAGEASGDLLASLLIGALKKKLPDAIFYGIGGPKMQAQGFDAWWPIDKLSVMGYIDALKNYREIAGIRRQLKKRLLELRPDIFIGVDAPDFNLGLEIELKAAGIKTIHYVSPSIWAWRSGRIKKIGRAVNRLLALFPMEPPLYEKENIPVTFVGHPLADIIPLETSQVEVRDKLGIARDVPVFALLPGSRKGELEKMADTFVQTARLIRERFLPDALFVVPLTTRETRLQFEAAIYRQQAAEVPFRLLFGHAQDALGAACRQEAERAGERTGESCRPLRQQHAGVDGKQLVRVGLEESERAGVVRRCGQFDLVAISVLGGCRDRLGDLRGGQLADAGERVYE